MKIRQSKEILILTKEEKVILSKANEILNAIYDECECSGELESYSREAKENINDLLEVAEVEGGEPTGVIKVTIATTM